MLYSTARPSTSKLAVDSRRLGSQRVLTSLSCIHAAQHHSEGKTLVVCRVPKHDEISLTTALDAGAAGIVIPHTESAQDIRDKVKDVFYREYTRPLGKPGTVADSPQHPSASVPSARGPSPPAFPTSQSTPRTSST
jgi:hypothetical protein